MTADTMTPMTGKSSQAEQHREGTIARTIEQQTAKLPSDTFLWAAGASIIGSLVLNQAYSLHLAA